MNANETIKSLRSKLDLTQEQFAVLLGTSKQNIYSMEKGRSKPKTEMASRLLKLAMKNGMKIKLEDLI
jgi:DNA-binding transcriptional regulator YiaG